MVYFRTQKSVCFANLASVRSLIEFFRRTSPLPQRLFSVRVFGQNFLRVKFAGFFFSLPQIKKLGVLSAFFYFLLLFYISLNCQFKVSLDLNYKEVMLSNAGSEYGHFMNFLFSIFTRYNFTLRSYADL